jgi:hypothetical protein
VFARVTLGEAFPERLDEAPHEVIERVLLCAEEAGRFRWSFSPRPAREWQSASRDPGGSEQAMKATEEVAYWLRVFSALLAYRGAIFKNAQSAKEALVL